MNSFKIATVSLALAATLAMVGCSAINSQADANKAAEVIGLGPTSAKAAAHRRRAKQ